MSNIVFVQDGVVTSAPASYGIVDFSIGGQLARKQLPQADGRTARGMASINICRQAITDTLKDPAVMLGALKTIGVNRLVIG
ncbi:hypothetical protein IACHDJAJ_00013 [Aeromonas phage vB_AdhS_TS3]|nr:hypothetical protein IACHDJAJ_00013 [Aeromonas phage vB_AdhS_TS3]